MAYKPKILEEVDGGTAQSSYATGDILYASASNTLSKLPAGSDGEVLTLASGAPSWASGADIEEGSFTPTIEGVSTSGAGTYTAQVGRYQKIGKWVSVYLRVVWTAHTGTGNMRLNNLPYVAVNQSNNVQFLQFCAPVGTSTVFSNAYVTARMVGGALTAQPLSYNNVSGGAVGQALPSVGDLVFTGTYETD